VTLDDLLVLNQQMTWNEAVHAVIDAQPSWRVEITTEDLIVLLTMAADWVRTVRDT
jgi:hypothetical protein